LIEDRDLLQANATITGFGLLIFFIISLSVSLEQNVNLTINSADTHLGDVARD
jgi:hypothetical protein